MLRYIISRVIYLLPVLFVMSLIVFMLIHLIPGDPVDAILGNEASHDAREALRVRLGLDRPVVVQYLVWISHVLTGDLGTSAISGKPVAATIIEKAGVTIFLALGSIGIALIIGILGGTVAAARKGSWIDFTVLTTCLVGLAVPTFWLGIMFILLFSVNWQLLPAIGYTPPGEDFASFVQHLTLPVATLGIVIAGALARLTRSEMIEQLGRDYILTAKAKGLSETEWVFKHGLRNALIPVVTFTGLELGAVMGSAVIIESIFVLPGVGQLVVASILSRDYPMVQGIILFLSAVFVLINLLVDISYTILDPQIRLDGSDRS